MLFKNTFFAFAFLLFSSLIHAQIGLGTKSIAGNIEMSYQNSSAFNWEKPFSSNLNLSPAFSTFISKRALLTINPIINQKRLYFACSQYGYFIQDEYALNSSFRYYFNSNGKLKIFGSAGLNFSTQKNYYSDDPYSYRESKFLTSNVGLGFNYFFNNSVALNVSADYEYAIGTNNRREDIFSAYQIKVGLENFISANSEQVQSDSLLYRGKKLVAFNLKIYKKIELHQQSEGYINFMYGRFILKNLVLGVEFTDRENFYPNRNYPMAGIFARYYIGLGKRFFIHPELDFKVYLSPEDYRVKWQKANTISLGMSYFLKKNVAIEANLLQYDLTDRFQRDLTKYQDKNLNVGLNIGMRYFLN